MKLARWLITLAYAGFIFYLSSRTWSGPELFQYSDKVIHFMLYALLGGLCLWSLRTTTLRNRAAIVGMAAAAAAVYGASDELHQSFIPGRTMSGVDLLFDTIGAIIGAWLAWRMAKLINRGGANQDAHQT